MTNLTTTQYSALGELRRRGNLRPAGRSFDPTTGQRTYSRRTLDALVDQGYAEWRTSVRGTRNGPVTYDGFVTPKMVDNVTPVTFPTSYMDRALYNLDDVIKQAQRDLRKVDFDTLVGTGFSGGVVIPALAMAMNKDFLLIRKETDDSHHGKGKMLGRLGQRWIFVDDFVSSGRTRSRVKEKVADGAFQRQYPTTFVGEYLYCGDGIFRRHEDTGHLMAEQRFATRYQDGRDANSAEARRLRDAWHLAEQTIRNAQAAQRDVETRMDAFNLALQPSFPSPEHVAGLEEAAKRIHAEIKPKSHLGDSCSTPEYPAAVVVDGQRGWLNIRHGAPYSQRRTGSALWTFTEEDVFNFGTLLESHGLVVVDHWFCDGGVSLVVRKV